MDISQNFGAFSEYMNFKKVTKYVAIFLDSKESYFLYAVHMQDSTAGFTLKYNKLST